MRLKRRLLSLAFVALLALTPLAWAGESVQLYTTGISSSNPATGAISASGTENSGIVKASQAVVLMAAFQNYDGSSAKIAMLFDATTLPSNGAIPRLAVSVPAHTATGAPGQASLALPMGGVSFVNGVVWACSTTDKTLTVDTTSGGNCYAQITFQ